MTDRYRFCAAHTVAIPALGGTAALRDASADDLRVLLCLMETGGEAQPRLLADRAGCSEARVCAALEYWQQRGILEPGADRKTDHTPEPAANTPVLPSASLADSLHRLTPQESAALIDRKGLKELLDECQNVMGRAFSSTDIVTLASLYDQLGMDRAYLLTLVSYCVNTLQKNSMRYLEKTALALHDRGIDTMNALEAYIHEREQYHAADGWLRRMFGIGDREPSKTQRECFEKWVLQYGYDRDVVAIAYDITVNNTQKADVRYTDKILTAWYTAGLRTPEQITVSLEAERRKKEGGKGTPAAPKKKEALGSFDTEEFFRNALRRSYSKGE